MADKTSTILAEATLQKLFLGASVSGVRFGVTQLLFDPQLHIAGEPYINLASSWTLYSSRPAIFPEEEFDLPKWTAEEDVLAAVSLRHKVVATIEILTPWPHLVLTFTDGTILFLNGKNHHYEPWTAGLCHAPPDELVQVIACPGGELALILPKEGPRSP